MNIRVLTIPHNRQRYNTIGDWQFDAEADELYISVSEMKDPEFEQAVAVHELVEALLCIHDGVTQKQVDAFDMSLTDEDCEACEPGDMPDAPYQRQHCIATGVERLLIAAMGIKWSHYDDHIVALCNTYRKEKRL